MQRSGKLMTKSILDGLDQKQLEEFEKFFDHTLLRPDATENDIKNLCREAAQFAVAAVCVNPFYVSLASSLLRDTEVKVVTVVGFPLGSDIISVKTFEARRAIQEGTQEVDMVINIGALKDRKYDYVYQDIFDVVKECRLSNCTCKVIIETGLLTDEDKKKACEIIISAGAHFVKTSTGIGSPGATLEDVNLIRECLKDSRLGIKASGGIRTLTDTILFVKAGATRIGTSSTVKILQEYRQFFA
jgi:deoxyribose-phosphate aldolase